VNTDNKLVDSCCELLSYDESLMTELYTITPS